MSVTARRSRPLVTTTEVPGPPSRRGSLPLYRAGGESEPVFLALQGKESAVGTEVDALDVEILQRQPLLSVNAKTSLSLDFPIGQTCDPTPLCARVCYGSRADAPATWSKSLRKRLRNLRYVSEASSEQAAVRLTREFEGVRRRWAKRGVTLDYLRVNGTGDLFPALIPVLNAFATSNPGVRLWIVTRRFELAAQIVRLPNIFLQLSLDATTPPELERTAREIIAVHPRAYLSFLRSTPTDDTRGAAIVFNQKGISGLPYDRRTDCPVDAGRLSLGNRRGIGGTACAKCRKCFTETVLVRQHHALEELYGQNPGPVQEDRR